MKTAEFDYHLPAELIAQKPAEPRDSSRLLVVDRASGALEHRRFSDLPHLLKAGDCLVVNETRVIPARLIGRKANTGGRVEVLLLSELETRIWEALVKPGRRISAGQVIDFDGALSATVGERRADGVRTVEFAPVEGLHERLRAVGQVPLPPYVHEPLGEPDRYQTVYARRDGSVAAPTAGLHFTPQLLEALRGQGVAVAPVVLNVGLDTFQPVRATEVESHRMHSEHFAVPEESARLINEARRSGGSVVAVGTTSARVLESVASETGEVSAASGRTDLFIYPGYQFKAVDRLLTNFHVPRSTLMMMVCAFAGRDLIMRVYAEAIRAKYRLLSFGDAMLIT